MILSAETRSEIERQRERYPQARSAILPALWAVQNQLGNLTPDGMREVAVLLGLAPSEVQAVASFYSMYFDKPGGRHHVLVCVNVSCGLRGADDIVAHIGERLGCASGGTSDDGEFTWESTIECLGACGGAPAMQIDHRFHENLTAESVDAILDRIRGSTPAHGHGNGHAPATTSLPPAAPAPNDADLPAGPAGPPAPRQRPRRSRPQPTSDDL